MTNTQTWPLIEPNDDGIRPAGPPDACFYCDQKVGARHGFDCVIVTKRVEMRVRAKLPSGEFAGSWQFDEPHSWDARMSQFYRNESSWCAGNFMRERAAGTVVWDVGDPWPEIAALNESSDQPGGRCLCGFLQFEFVRVVDATPRRKLRESAS
jgi:hypothetical protein